MPAKKKVSEKKAAAKKTSAKTTAPKASAETAPKSTGPAKKSGSRGKRYTAKEKAKVVGFVNEVNAAKGRGGAAAASRKFKVSQLTIGRWLKEAPGTAVAPVASSKRRAKAKSSATGLEAKLAQLASVASKIDKTDKELKRLRADFDRIKKTL